MKKAGSNILVIVTLIFTSLLCGFYIGRNFDRDVLTVSALRISTASLPDPTEAAVTEVSAANAPTQAPSEEPTTEPVSTADAIVNINTASKQLLDALPGIGEVIAQRIIDYREENGPFESIEELLNVSGIGEKKLEELREFVTVGG